jgi:hypothetical protein
MIAYSRQLILLRRDELAILALDLPGGAPLLREPARNDDALAVILGFVGFFALILDCDGDFGYTIPRRSIKRLKI